MQLNHLIITKKKKKKIFFKYLTIKELHHISLILLRNYLSITNPNHHLDVI